MKKFYFFSAMIITMLGILISLLPSETSIAQPIESGDIQKNPDIDSTSNSWSYTGNMNECRQDHTATRLSDQKVLVVGGRGFSPTYQDTAEIYDPDSGTWSNAASLSCGRRYHTATLLQNGKVLVVGGVQGDGHDDYLNTAVIYDPVLDTWSDPITMDYPRAHHTATLLPNGQVLVAGGVNPSIMNSVEIYDPATGTFSPTSDMNQSRSYFAATLLQDDTVLVVGGWGFDLGVTSIRDTAEIYNPDTAAWTLITDVMSTPRQNHTTSLLNDGRVLVAGGLEDTYYSVNTAEIFDPTTQTFGDPLTMNNGRGFHTATRLPSGKVLIAGGREWYEGYEQVTLDTAEIYDPDDDSFELTPPMLDHLKFHTATLLAEGKVLVAGGDYMIYQGGLYTSWRAELFTPEEYTLSVVISPVDSGTVTAEPTLTTYPYGSEVTLTPVPNAGYAFDYWSGADAAELSDNGDGSWSIIMDADKSLTANLNHVYVLSIAISPSGSGSVTRNPDLPVYDEGDMVVLTPVPSPGYSFDQWTGTDVGDLVNNGDGTWSLTMTEDKSLTANFIADNYSLTLSISPLEGGSVTIDPEQASYLYGDIVTLTPVPSPGYSFDQWTGTNAGDLVNNGDGTWSLTIDENKDLTANFCQVEFSLTITIVPIGSSGSVSRNPNKASYTYAEEVVLTPENNSEYEFNHWTGDHADQLTDNGDGTWTMVMDGDKHLTANFSEIEIIDAGGGVITFNENEIEVTVPKDTLDSETKFSFISQPEPTQNTGSLVFAGISFQLSAADTFSGDPVTVFEPPLTIKIFYDESALGEISEDSIKLFYWDKNAGDWVDVVTTCLGGVYLRDLDANWFSVDICHLSEFAVLSSGNNYSIFLPLFYE